MHVVCIENTRESNGAKHIECPWKFNKVTALTT